MMANKQQQSPGKSDHHKNSDCFLPSNSLLLALSPSFAQNPFLLRPILKKSGPELPPPLHELHRCVASAVENCSRFLQSLASENPIVKTIISLSPAVPLPSFSRRTECKVAGSANFAAILPGDAVAGVVVANGILNFLNIYNSLLVIRLVLTWFPNSPPAIVSPLSTLCDPYLNIFRGIIPPLGGTLDLSPILAFLVLNAFTSTASAIPAELPPPGEEGTAPPVVVRRSPNWLGDLTTSQRKWMSRLHNSKSSKASH
ncbi:unnamed protein product [Linum tenue]|uniref:Uncharacterized protein n=1 Tax=Linum tenue TaxID=586396 RepID=A0AAV0IYH8_9ROSI|nr:unnamed protein product [Linum tenue]